MLREFYQLTKPGIIYGNAMTASAGFLVAANGHIRFTVYIGLLLGLACIIGAACVYNNYLDRNIDTVMVRTKKRALVTGKVSPWQALLFATGLLVIGSILLLLTNLLTLGTALFGIVAYVAAYGYAKRHTVHGTLIGSVSGAMPPVIGYSAVTGRLDLAALLLFATLVCWQMPHFYAIALYRKDDYRAAGLPVLPLVAGETNTKIQILIYAIAFTLVSCLLTVYGYTGLVYLLAMLLVGSAWIWRGWHGLSRSDTAAWARSMFLFSLIVITLWSLLISLTAWLP